MKFKLCSALTGIIIFLLLSCSGPHKNKSFDKQLADGEFTLLKQRIDSLRTNKSKQKDDFYLDSIKQVIQAIRYDFSLTEPEVKKQLEATFPSLSDSDMKNWEQSGKLEMRYINDKKRYFKNAVPNLRRLLSFDSEKKNDDSKSHKTEPNSLSTFRLEHTTEVIEACNENSNTVLPQDMIVTYTLTVKPNAVPPGNVIRCWLPAPREGNPRQTGFQLLKSEPTDLTIAPHEYLQRTFYMEKTAEKDKPTVFSVRFSIQTKAQYFNLKPEDIQPYDKTNKVYSHYTEEQPPHLVFSSEIVGLAKRIVGDETNPMRKVEAIYRWISNSIPWASALEYCTMPNIPDYVLTNRHGDCGMQTLLFMSLARSQGIPVKWQSGFMLHPGHVNLHDWCEVYYEGIGWVPLDQSFKLQQSENEQLRDFYIHGIDAFRLIVNDGYGMNLYPAKKYPRSEPNDFQRGELEWDGGNLYFDQWSWDIDVMYQKN